jgi:pyrroline-5-carboxylate reductase
MKVALIGGGNMGEAIVSALLGKRVSLPGHITVSDASEPRRRHLQQTHGVVVTDNNCAAADGADVVILAVKPQHLTGVMTDLTGHIKPGQLVLSIVAGARIATIGDGLHHKRIVRSMPNTPAQVGEGMTVWMATPDATARQRNWARSILGVMGKEILVDDERTIDMATALSGSGPAYFFLFLEVLIDAAVSVGLPRDMARVMALQTMLGAGRLMEKSGNDAAELRRMVTSPGGTTAEAVRVFEEGHLGDLVARAVTAAYRKARLLGGDKV